MARALALLGGRPVRTDAFPHRRTMGDAETQAALRVLDSDELSSFIGGPGPHAFGGVEVLEFERRWAEAFGYRHAISVNSWSTGLTTCIAALGLGWGDEMICPPFTMSASAACGLPYGVVPVFADLDEDTYCLDPRKVEAAITPRTRAIMVVHLFGLPADMDALTDIARRHDLFLIEDAAQSPKALYKGKPVGAVVNVGGFSLNYHKHIHTGEGGMIVTDDDGVALRAKLVRNHAENFLDEYPVTEASSTVGSNYRMTELQAAIGIAQLDRLDNIIATRQALAEHLTKRLTGVPGIRPPVVPEDRTHVWYLYPIRFVGAEIGISRWRFVEAVAAELPTPDHPESTPLREGYVRPLHLSPLFSQRSQETAERGLFPLQLPSRYGPGVCPVAERLHNSELMLSFLVREPLEASDLDDFADAVVKVVENADALRGASWLSGTA